MEKHNTIRQYGLNIKPPKERDPNAYVLGGVIDIPKIVLQANGQWTDYLPVNEKQHTPQFDSFGCTTFGTLNCLEILLKRLEGKEYNFAERYPYNIVEIIPPGADPHDVAMAIYENGLITQEELPMTETLEEFMTPRPMTAQYLVKGQQFDYELKHSFVFKRSNSKEMKIAKMKECLRYSPLAISVTAWQEEDGVYVDNGQPNTHWVCVYGWNDKGWLAFDSYEPHLKTVSFEHNIEVAKRYLLEKKTIKKTYWFIDIIRSIIKLWK